MWGSGGGGLECIIEQTAFSRHTISAGNEFHFDMVRTGMSVSKYLTAGQILQEWYVRGDHFDGDCKFD